ncbi:MAG: hypothetical protein ACK5L5_09325 [Bacteroidales bacterium]
MNALKNLLAIKEDKTTSSSPQQVTSSSSVSTGEDQLTSTYYNSGYSGSLTAFGSSSVFRACLEDIYEKFKNRCREDVIEQQRLNAPYEQEIETQKCNLKGRQALKEIKEESAEKTADEIERINSDIANVKNDPAKYGVDASRKPRAQFFIGFLILLAITAYVLVFYISASYSAFFKEFDPASTVIGSIFDAQAFSKAVEDGWLEAVFISTIPFAFMGLGYVIHMLQEHNKSISSTLKVIGLYLITFIFDAILAYQIEEKLYDLNKTLESPEFNLSHAFSSVGFWGIIFAGFVVYFIWGLVFDFVMKEHANVDKIKAFIDKLNEEKEHLIRKKTELLKQIETISQEIIDVEGKIQKLQTKVDGFIFPNRKYLLYHSEYVKGWYMAISVEIALPHAQKQGLLKECEYISQQHLENKQVDNEHYEEKVYNLNK